MPFKKPHQTSDPAFIKEKTDNDVKGFDIYPRGLNIIWGNDPRYWKTTTEDCAELIQVSWLEVSGKVTVKEGGEYVVKFHVRVNQNGFGWDSTPVLVMAKVGKRGKYEYKETILECGRPRTIPEDGNVSVTVKSNADLEIHFGLYEVWSGKWKGGLIIEKAEVIKVH